MRRPRDGAARRGDVVTIAAEGPGALRNTVDLSPARLEWTFGARVLMTNLAARGPI
jgi:fumarylacetoacetate (FAA) hydrolase family protein